MTSAVPAASAPDHTELRHVIRSSVVLGAVQSVVVLLAGVVSRVMAGAVELVLLAVLVVAGLAVTIVLPGLWTRARSIEGISGAAGIGLGATVVFLLVDVALYQPLGLYTNRWLAIGGGSNWWYHPVWWMAGTFLPWMGAWIMANQAAKTGEPNPATALVGTFIIAAVVMALTAVVGFPGAAFGLGTFGVSVMPALVLMVLITGLGARRR